MSTTEASASKSKPIVLHIGNPIKYNPEQYAAFSSAFTVIRPTDEERQRDAFMQALRERRWGDFDAIFRPFWDTGGEMGRWDRELVPLLPGSVKVFASAGAGYDWADVDVLAERGIVYCNGASASSEAVADFALFLIIAVFRNLAWCTSAAHSGSPATFSDCHQNAVLQSHTPRGHVLGIIGLGNIGFAIAEKIHAALGMKIKYHDLIRKSPEIEAQIQAEFFPSLDDMLPLCDCVLIATPASPTSGRRLIDAERLTHFKRGSRLVNIARGSLVDEEAVADALDNGALVGAGLDVHLQEPEVNKRLLGRQNVTLTCHNAGGTVETHKGFEGLAMQNIEAVLKGEKPLTPVNLHLMKEKS